MGNKLLTDVIVNLVNKKAHEQEYGVSILNLPDFDYGSFINSLDCGRNIELFFLGFSEANKNDILASVKIRDSVSYSFSVEDAEKSRNSGDESIFRILIIKRVEIEKLSSLRWFPEISLERVYAESCDYTKQVLSQTTNAVIDALIRALKRKTIRNILNFERVLEYLEDLLEAQPTSLPEVVKGSFYKLGLCNDNSIVNGKPSVDEYVKKIKHNHDIVERIRNLEQAERQSITNYYADSQNDKEMPRLILQFYRTKDITLLKMMEVDEVEKCLKAAKRTPKKPPKPNTQHVNPTALAAQLVFDDNTQQIDSVLEQIAQEVDNRSNAQKKERIEVEYDGGKAQLKTEPVSEKIAEELIGIDDFGGRIWADVQTPSDALEGINVKYPYEPFKKEYLDVVWESLQKLSKLLSDGESISTELSKFLEIRNKLIPYRKRLQDAPMLQVISKKELFTSYLNAYERLLTAINDDFPKIWKIAPSNAKEIINIVISMDNIFILGSNTETCHAIPTPLNPLYLWKYVMLADEMLSGRGVSDTEEVCLSEDDQNFIIRKAEDIPDPLTVMLLPVTVRQQGAMFLPLAGRIGTLPIYSTQKQINQSESGTNDLKQAIIRYMCLYPHAGMMLKIAIIDPPSVELVVGMLKLLNNDREFTISGISITIYRTKEASTDWVEIEDESLNEGMLGAIRDKRSLNFQLKIANKKMPYQKIIAELNEEQHILVIFDPNEVRVATAQNNKQIHIHPLCVPKVYQYNPIDEKVEIRPANEGGIFSVYASILEKLNEHPSTFSHTSTFFNTPLKRDTYEELLNKADWLIILDQSLKSWDISLRAASEKLFYRENDYRSMGIYSRNSYKFVRGYDYLIKQFGNFIPQSKGIENIIQAIREINDDGLLSIVSHSSNRIFEENHGKGSLGLAISAIHYRRINNDAMLVGLDTQLAREWLSDRDDRKLPDLVGIRFKSEEEAIIDLIEVKTYSDNEGAFQTNGKYITGHAVEQVSVLEGLIREIFGASEKITTVARKEILREQVFDCLLQSDMEPTDKHLLSEKLNALFAGEFKLLVNKFIYYVNFENSDSSCCVYYGKDEFENHKFSLTTIGSAEIQSILSDSTFESGLNLISTSEETEEMPNVEKKKGSDEGNRTVDNIIADDNDYTGNSASSKLDSIDEKENSLIEEDVSTSILDEEERRVIREKCARLNKVFRDYGIQAHPVNPDLVQEATRFTRFSVELKSGETVRSIEKYKMDIGIQLEANGEILVDHIRGTKYISVDVPFAGSTKTVSLIENLYRLDSSKGKLDVLAGQMPDGKFEILDLAKAPHLLVAGTTGSGKTIFLYSIIVSLLKKYGEQEIQLLIIDPKQTDFTFFEDLPNLYGQHVVTDAEEALEMIRKINDEDKEKRTALLKSNKSRDIDSYNEKNPANKMKRLVVVIDEYSDLIQAAEMLGTRKEFEKLLVMLAQRVRNLGIHLVIATQRPSAQIVTGTLKANIPFRVSFRLPSHTDSQTILDMSGAENLLGKGDMLMVTDSDTKRMQGLFITESELVEFLDGR